VIKAILKDSKKKRDSAIVMKALVDFEDSKRREMVTVQCHNDSDNGLSRL
jgi:hypothetical protein